MIDYTKYNIYILKRYNDLGRMDLGNSWLTIILPIELFKENQ